jgi:DNA-directed RNA polymerase subunit beta'
LYNNRAFNQVIDVWTSANAQLTELAMKKKVEKTNKGSTQCMMLDSEAGVPKQIRQLTGMHGFDG